MNLSSDKIVLAITGALAGGITIGTLVDRNNHNYYKKLALQKREDPGDQYRGNMTRLVFIAGTSIFTGISMVYPQVGYAYGGITGIIYANWHLSKKLSQYLGYVGEDDD